MTYEDWKKKREDSTSNNQSNDDDYTRWLVSSGKIDINAISNEISNRTNKWLRNNKTLIGSYNDRFVNGKVSYKEDTLPGLSDAKNALREKYKEYAPYREDSSEWLSSVTEQNSSLAKEAESIKAMLQQYKSLFGEDYINSISDAFDSNLKLQNDILSASKQDYKYWSNWDTEADYYKYLDEQEEYNKMLTYDLKGAKAEIDYWEERLAPYTSEIPSYSRNDSEMVSTPQDKAAILQQRRQDFYMANAMSLDDAEAMLAEKKRYYKQAERAQYKHQFEVVADKESEYYDPDFAEKSTYIAPNADAIKNDPVGSSLYTKINEGISSSSDSLYKHLNKQEIAIFNYHYNTEGYGKAQEYLNSLKETLTYREGAEIAGSKDSTFSKILFGFEAGLDQFASGMQSLFSDEDYIVPSATQVASGIIREDLADNGIPLWYNFKEGKWEDKIFGASSAQIGYDALNTTSNMLPSILAGAAVELAVPTIGEGFATAAALMKAGKIAGQVTSGAVMGMSSAGHGRAEMLNLGYSKEQANAYGLMVGASEAGLGYLLGGISSFGGVLPDGITSKILTKVDNALARTAIQLGGKIGSEALEEGLQTVIEPWLKEIATGVDWDAPNIDEILYSSLLGALSAGMLESPGTIKGEVSTYKAGKKIRNTNGGVGKLQAIATNTNYFSADSVAYKIASKVDATTDAYTIGRLLREVGGTISEQNYTDIVNGLVEKGISERNAKRIAMQYQAYLNGEMNLTDEQVKTIENLSPLADVLRKKIIGANTTVYQRTREYADLMNLANEVTNSKKGKTSKNAEASAESITSEEKDNYVSKVEKIASEVASGSKKQKLFNSELAVKKSVKSASEAAEERLGVEGRYTSSNTGETLVPSKYNVSLAKDKKKIVGVASIENGTMKVKLDDGSVVDAEKIDFSTSDEALVYEAVANMGVSANTAWEILKGYDSKSGQSGTIYAMGALEAYTYGHNGVKVEGMSQDGFSSLLSPVQKNTANRLGDIDARAKVESQQKTIDKAVKSVRDEARSKHKAIPKRKGEVVFEGDHARLTDLQEKQLDVLGKIAEGLGVTFHIFESDENFKYTMPDGKVRSANGWYDHETGEIWIDLKAGNIGQGTIIFTAAHELTHFIKQWSPAKFKVFADFLVEQYGKKGQDINQLIERQIEKASAKGRTISWDTAYEEVIADSCETFLRDSKAAERIAALREKDINLANKIKTFLGQMLAKMRKVMADLGLAPETPEGQMVAEMTDSLQKLYDLWTDALADAGTAYSTLTNINLDTESVAPMLSERTWTASEYVTEREETAKKISKTLGVDMKTAYKYIDDINSVAKLIADDRARLDYEPNLDEHATVLKPNSEYKYSVDMSTLCAKRLLFTGTFDAIQRALPNTVFDSEDIVALREMMQKRGYEVACGICYVESTRREIGRITQDFINSYKESQKTGKPITRTNSEGKVIDLKKTNDEKASTADKSTDKFFAEKDYTPTLADLNTTDIDLVKRDHPLVYEAYLNFMNARGQAKPKLLETRAEYKGEILKHFKVKSAVTSRNNAGGLRLQSFSDFEVPHLIDMMQIVMDMSRVGLKSQAYTKVPAFAEVFGDTGVKINLSLIAKGDGLDANGNLIFDDVEGINHKEAFKLRDKYSKNVGTILVGKTDAHIIAAMADPRIDYIIPFHKSSWKESLYDALGLTGYADYTDYQNEKPINKDRTIKNFDPSEYWDFSKTGDENAQIYLQKCREDGRIPKFPQFQGYPGYWKLLIDFKMYDNDGIGSPQEVVRPTFNTEASERILSEYKGGHKSFPVAKDVVEDFVKEHEDKVKFSNRNSNNNEENPIDNKWENGYNLYTATDDFIRQVPYGLRHDFARSLANKTSGMTDGEIKTVYVCGYIFEADGYMHGHILAPYNEKTKKLLKERRLKYGRINEDTEIASVWSETVRNAERGSGSDIGVPRRGRSSSDDRLLGASSERHSSGNNERVRQTFETKEEIDEIVKSLREMYGFDESVGTKQNEEADSNISFSLRKEAPPKKTEKAYKLMRLVDGKLYPLFIGNNEEVSVGTWYNADSPNLSQLKNLAPGTHLVDMKTGEAMTWDEYAEKYVPTKNGKPTRSKPNVDDVHWANDNGYRFMHIEEKAGGKSEGRMLKQYGDTRAYYNWGVNGSSKSESGEGSASLYALRPGWHFGEVPTMHQIGYDGAEGDTVRLDNQVWVEVEMSADVDYNAEAASNWGGDIPTHIPTNGYYKFATNPTQKKTKGGNTEADLTKSDWYVAGAFKVNRILSDSEADSIVDNYNKVNGKKVPLDYRRNYGRVFNAETMSIEDPVRYSDRVLMGSLFSGGGTLEAGLVYQMLDKEFAVEYKASLASAYTDNFGKEHMFVGDVREFNSKDKQNVFYLHASPVCKSYSPASHKGGERNDDIITAQATARVLEEQMPQVFTVENVRQYIGSEAYNIIINKLNKLGYTWDVAVYKASDYGNATKRERMIIRAVKDGELPAKPQKASNITSWGEATRDLWETDLIPSYLVQSKIAAINNTPQLKGIDLKKLDKPLMIYDTTKSKTATFAWADELAPTLTTKCGDARIIMPDGNVYAPTPRFMGRIQGLPDDYKYPKATTNAFMIIGNGIPTQLTKAVMGGVLDSAYEQTHDGEVLYSERVSNKELAEMDETALYIKNTKKANYIGMIFSGMKTEETRSTKTLDAFIGKDFYVTDGKYVYGSIVLGEPHQYTAKEFHDKENQKKHRVPKGDKYDIKPSGTKWAYPIESYKKFDKPQKLSESKDYKNSFQARQVLYSNRNTTTDTDNGNDILLFNGKPFWIAMVNRRTGNIEATWTYAEAESEDFDLARYEDITEKDGYVFFTSDLLQDNGRIEYDDYGDRLPDDLIEKINKQIEVKHNRTSSRDKYGMSKAERIYESLKHLAHLYGYTEVLDEESTPSETVADMDYPFEEHFDENYTFDDWLSGKFSDRSPSAVSTRTLLANALETTAQNDIERTKISQYKSKIALIEAEYAKLAEIKKQANDIRFTKGRTSAETKQMKALEFEANQIANRINVYDRQLLNLESTTALKNVLQREKELARRKEAKKGKEALARQKEREAKTIRTLMDKNAESRKKAAESRNKTEMRHKIRKVVDDLNKLLLNPTKDKHVPISLQKYVASALAVINMDTVGAEERIAKYNELIAKAKDPDEIARLTKSRDNIELQGESLKDKLTTLQNAYAALLKSDDPLIKNAYDETIENLIANTITKVGDTSLRNMSLEQLDAVYDMFKAIKASVRNANKMFKEGRQETITANSEWVKREVSAAGGHRNRVLKATKFLKKFGWNMLKPIYAMKLIGSDTLTALFENVRKGEDTWAVDVNEAKDFFKETAKKYEYNTWDFEKPYKFTDSAGHSFSLTLEQIMSLYAYSKRDQADLHLEKGGFVFDDSIEVVEKNKLGIPMKYEVNDANPYILKKDDLDKVIDLIKTDMPNVKGFVDEMQAYLSDVMGEKGNEVSLAMYDIKLYNEANYFPLKTAKYFREFDPEKNGTPKIKNSGFSKNTVPQAGNPIILSNFMDVWASHVNDMSMYHAFVLPLEDFMRVYNYSSTAGGYDSVQQYIKNAYGVQANSYIESLMNDLNGGARTDPATDIIGKGMSLFKKAAVFASASVVIQQPSAIARAMAYIDAKYFVDKPEATKHSETWAEVKKYAPVAIIKEMGYFDTNMGKSTVEWIKEEKTWKDKVDDIASKAPALADELAWCAIWKAVKREVADSTNLEVGSEAFLKLAGKRFTEVVTKTQVYDSVLSRSALMRSKDTGAKMITAFMAEPTTSLNMVVDAIIEGKRGNKKFAGKAIGAVASSIILNSILVSLVTAARDDDEDETYLEKYLGSLTAELLDGFNPLTYIPLIKDIWSIMQGYDIERSDMSIWSDLWQSVENLFSENKSGFEKTEGVVGSIASIFGLPLKNILRDARGMYNLGKTLLSDTHTTWEGVGDAVGDAFKSSIPLYKKFEKLLEADESEDSTKKETSIKASDINSAFEKGDTDAALEVIEDLIKTKVANGMTEKEAKSSIRSSMTSYWKPLYKKAYKNKDTAEQERIKRILKDSGLYGNASEVIKTIREWRSERD